MARIITKGLIGVQDLSLGTSTFTRATSTGGTQTLNQINAVALGGANVKFQFFVANSTFTIPASVSSLKVTVVGAGGGGGGSTSTNNGGGGAGGGIGIKWLSGLTPGLTLAVTVGTGGAGNSGANGSDGGASTVASGTQTISTITGTGGGHGIVTGVVSAGGSTLISTGGDLNFSGSPGQLSGGTIGGCGGGSLFGGGGANAQAAVGNPSTSVSGGGGGSGTNGVGNLAGGTGGGGIVIFEWVGN